ncbi:MAG: histidine phosphatase family protein [Oscillospiraceae bacterium]
MKGYRIKLLRHGMTAANLEGRFIGRTDRPLCEEGEAQLTRAQEEHDYGSVQKVYSSPLSRCIQTAEILYPDARIAVVPELTELDFGIFEEKTAEELVGMPGYKEFLKGGLDNAPPGGESVRALIERCYNGIGTVIADMMEEGFTNVAAVTHGGVMMNLLACFGLPKRKPLEYACGYGEGFEILVTAAMWQRSGAFEILGKLPE